MSKKTIWSDLEIQTDGLQKSRTKFVSQTKSVSQTEIDVTQKRNGNYQRDYLFCSFGEHPGENQKMIKLGRNVTFWRGQSNEEIVALPRSFPDHKFESFPVHPGDSPNIIRVGKTILYKEQTHHKVAEWPAHHKIAGQAENQKQTRSTFGQANAVNRCGLFSRLKSLFSKDNEGHGPIVRMLNHLRRKRETLRNNNARHYR